LTPIISVYVNVDATGIRAYLQMKKRYFVSLLVHIKISGKFWS